MTGKTTTTTATLSRDATTPERFPDFPPRDDMQNWRYLYRPGILNSLSIYLAGTLPADATVMCEVPVAPSLSARHRIRIPDLSVTLDGDSDLIDEQGGYAIDSQGKPLDFVLEIASLTTGEADYTDKRLDYEEFGVLEYWRFDSTGGEFHDAPLAADRLVDGEYRPIEIVEQSDGLLWGYSEVLGVELCWDEGILRLRDPATGEFLRTPDELNEAYLEADALATVERAARETAEAQAGAERAAREATEARANAERAAREAAERRAGAAEQRADAERTARETAEARIAEMEAELRRLRG